MILLNAECKNLAYTQDERTYHSKLFTYKFSFNTHGIADIVDHSPFCFMTEQDPDNYAVAKR